MKLKKIFVPLVTALVASSIFFFGCGSDSDTRAGSDRTCDESYPTVCIPPYPPDLDCGEISHKRFEVFGLDPHGFDRDNDGIGCEN